MAAAPEFSASRLECGARGGAEIQKAHIGRVAAPRLQCGLTANAKSSSRQVSRPETRCGLNLHATVARMSPTR